MEPTPNYRPDPDELLNDTEGARLLRLGVTTFFEIQKRPDFPPPLWPEPRLKRPRRGNLPNWALSKQRTPQTAPA